MWSLSTAQRAIIIAGCMAMAYTQLTLSPATIEFARAHGASGLHVGILGALPTAMLFMQFVAAVVVNHLTYRRWLWLTTSFVQRLICLPVAIGPLLWPELPSTVWVWGLVTLMAVNQSLLHFGSPLWLSWMGDYLPREGISHYWGRRHFWQQWTAALSFLLGAALLFGTHWHIDVAFAVLMVVASVAGLSDVLLFLKVEEPRVRPMPQPTLARVLSAPFQDRQFRSLIAYSCFWNFAAMVGAPFISIYLLDYLGMSLASVMLLWAASWAGGALLSGQLGRLAENFGHRPLLILCTAAKPLGMLALIVVPFVPALAFWILVPVLMVDALLNAGINVATNGFMLKYSPCENRSMFIAASTALAGMTGGVTAVVAGALLTSTDTWSAELLGVRVVNYHLVFLVSLLLRGAAVALARRVHEPGSRGATGVVRHLVSGSPLIALRFPTGMEHTEGEPDAASGERAGTQPVHDSRDRRKVRQSA